MPDHPSASSVTAIERPCSQLLRYYALKCLLTGPLFPFVFVPHYFKYRTLRYRFDGEGISMRWGILFRREIILNYARIQDIHLNSNLIERWLGLAKIEVQTAAGSAAAEMTIEGVREFEAVRDFLYARMRGTKDPIPATEPSTSLTAGPVGETELVATLRLVAEELRAIRAALEKKDPAQTK